MKDRTSRAGQAGWVALALLLALASATSVNGQRPGRFLQVWELATEPPIWTAEMPGPALAFDVSSDGTRIVTAHRESDQAVLLVTWDADTGESLRRVTLQTASRQWSEGAVHFSPDLQWLAVEQRGLPSPTSDGETSSIEVWQVERGVLHQRFETPRLGGVSFSADSTRILVNEYRDATTDARLTWRDVETGNSLGVVETDQYVWAFNRASNTLVVSDNGQVGIIDAITGAHVTTLEQQPLLMTVIAHGDAVISNYLDRQRGTRGISISSVQDGSTTFMSMPPGQIDEPEAVSLDGRHLLTTASSVRSELRLWDLTTGQLIWTFPGLHLWRADFVPNRDRILTVGPAYVARETRLATVVTGQVREAGTGAPIEGAAVGFMVNTGYVAVGTLTDSEGRFRTTGLSAGVYLVQVGKERYLTARERIGVVEGETGALRDSGFAATLDFELHRAASISGRLTDSRGRSLVGVQVVALREDEADGQVTLRSALSPDGYEVQGYTDASGEYHLTDLLAGEYILQARVRSENRPYAPTFYPGVGTSNEATPVELAPGADLLGVDFVIRETALARVSGHVTNPDGTAATNGYLSIHPLEAVGPQLSDEKLVRIASDGTFEVPTLLVGRYVILADATPTLGDPKWIGYQAMTVTEAGIDGLAIQTNRGRALAGRIRIDDATSGTVDLTRLRVRGIHGSGVAVHPRLPVIWSDTTEDGSFTLTEIFGTISLEVRGLPRDWEVSSVTLNGQDVSAALEVSQVDTTGTVEIVLTRR